ncbi:uncharacterized protein [Halyomorpha halys]|uniref:uncharacterized protein n=1 Tax=Halyomorpha halys TaxID=286706 RepID=UPI0006D4C794|nr:uncharacterized protein LOC106685851 [Halyomorpha halys]
MDSRNDTDLQDSMVTTTQLSTTIGSVQSKDNFRINDCWNVLNSRFSFYASKKLSNTLNIQPKDDYKTAAAIELDCYMNSVLDRHIQQKLVDCAMKSESASPFFTNSFLANRFKKHKSQSGSNFKKCDHFFELMKLKLLNYEMNSREEQMFIESLDESERWQVLQEEFKERSNEAVRNFVDNPQNDNKLHESIKKDNLMIKKLDTINKALLMGIDVDYMEDEESKKIMFKDI